MRALVQQRLTRGRVELSLSVELDRRRRRREVVLDEVLLERCHAGARAARARGLVTGALHRVRRAAHSAGRSRSGRKRREPGASVPRALGAARRARARRRARRARRDARDRGPLPRARISTARLGDASPRFVDDLERLAARRAAAARGAAARAAGRRCRPISQGDPAAAGAGSRAVRRAIGRRRGDRADARAPRALAGAGRPARSPAAASSISWCRR